MNTVRTVNIYNRDILYRNENGHLHREDGHAFESRGGYKTWYINGERHREDGPARVWPNGSVFYYLNGKRYSREDWEIEVVKNKLKRIKNL